MATGNLFCKNFGLLSCSVVNVGSPRPEELQSEHER